MKKIYLSLLIITSLIGGSAILHGCGNSSGNAPASGSHTVYGATS